MSHVQATSITRSENRRESHTPIHTDGLEFIEFAAPTPHDMEDALQRLGFVCVADHRHKDVRLYRQNDINLIVNTEPHSLASEYAERHGPSSNALAFRVPDVTAAVTLARQFGLDVIESTAGPMELNIPAVRGLGDSLIYLVDRYGTESIYDIDFIYRSDVDRFPVGWFNSVDHVTQNVRQGELTRQVEFYKHVFGFEELQTFDIRGAHTGLSSIALISSCKKIKIPVNEPTESKSQIAEFLDNHHGGGVQHIALSTSDIYKAVAVCEERGTSFQATPSTYYRHLGDRNIEHSENIEKLEQHQILIDGSPNHGILLQIFTQDMIGPVFFEVIQRKGNQGFGEGNFQALFESIEHAQEERGYFDETV